MSKLDKHILPCAVVLTALPVEYQSVRRHLTKLQEEVYKGTVYERGIFLADECQWEVGTVQIEAGNSSAAAEAERAISYFQPQVILFVGVAGGLRDVHLGDVVAATKVYGYESGKSGKIFQTRPEVGRSTYRMEQRAKREAGKDNWLQRLGQPYPDPLPHGIVKPIAAGEKVLASTRSATWKFLTANYSDAVAIEMEGYGFLNAARANHQVDALIVRGISDLIDNKSEVDATNYQAIAARHASAFAFEVLVGLCKEELSPSFGVGPEQKTSSIDPGITDNKFTFQSQGSIHAPVQVGNNNTMNSYISPRDDIKEGILCIQRGKTLLLHRDYPAAQRYLAEAVHLLSEDQEPERNAQARFLLALAYLRGERPFGVTIEVWERVEELMQTASVIHPCYSLLYAFARFKGDFARHGWKKRQYLQEMRRMMQEAEQLPQTVADKENISILWKSQSALMQEK